MNASHADKTLMMPTYALCMWYPTIIKRPLPQSFTKMILKLYSSFAFDKK